MNQSTKLTLEISEIRERLNALNAKESLTESETAEILEKQTKYGDLERQFRAAVKAEDDAAQREDEDEPDAERREMSSILARANVGEILAAAVERRNTAGAEAELQAEAKLQPNQIPLDMLRGRKERRDVTPGATVGQDAMPVLAPVFANGDASFLGIGMPRVPAGTPAWPVLTTRPAVKGPFSDSTSVAETTGAFSVTTLAPERLQAAFFWRRTDAARFPNMADALRSALEMGLSEAMDSQIIAGSGHGLLDGNTLKANAATAQATYQTYVDIPFSVIDGRHASMVNESALLLGGETLQNMSTLYRSQNSNESAYTVLRELGVRMKVSAFVAAKASKKQQILVRIGNRTPEYLAPVWEGITLIPDEITQAAKGEIRVTAVMLANFALLRASGFKKQEVQIDA